MPDIEYGAEITAESQFAPGTPTGILLVNDGTRRIVRTEGVGADVLEYVLDRIATDYPDTIFVFWGNWNANRDRRGSLREGNYLPYFLVDGRPPAGSIEPVNQIPYLIPWRAHVARFAHELDASLTYRSAMAATAEDREFTFTYFATLAAHAWNELRQFADNDPDTPSGDTLWRQMKPIIETTMDRLCHECDIATFSRRFLEHANISLFRERYQGGQLQATNRDTNPWTPGITVFQIPRVPSLTEDQLIAARQRFYGYYLGLFPGILQYYDEVSGRADAPHSHE